MGVHVADQDIFNDPFSGNIAAEERKVAGTVECFIVQANHNPLCFGAATFELLNDCCFAHRGVFGGMFGISFVEDLQGQCRQGLTGGDELLFIQVIRLWIDQQPEEAVGWIGALRDKAINKALGLIHQSPVHPWTVNELASTVALARSAFSARFTELVGEPPLTYLTRWRMLRATRLLKNNVGVATIAESLGYGSEAAFRKAFKREMGMPPAAYRRTA